MPFCTNCGHRNPDHARFCSQCGTQLEGVESSAESTATIQVTAASDAQPKTDTSDRAIDPVHAAAVDALPTGHALLVVQRGPGSGSRFLLDKDLVRAGRNPDCDIFLDDVTVSRQHAEFHRTGDSFSVTDSGSLNGTYVNRDRIDTVHLTDGDEVQVGKYRLVFFAGHEA
ncbi:FHA domain-containing protein [Nocardioides sp.]|uniref:FHA domain-containing protein n=1 Tax=Nocardioides sp. TaxID=35761 RepID=UPI003563C847